MKPTVVAFDTFHRRHNRAGHPENARRLEETWNLLQVDGILTKLIQLDVTPAPLDAILRVHPRAYIDRLESAVLSGGGHLDADTYLTADSYQAALLSAGGLINVVDAVMQGKAANGMSLMRPPGHHATPDWGMGFCLLANISIAARWAQDHYAVERVLIVDFDVHHGNGTQDVFYADPSVLFFSTHQYPFYPGSGAARETGQGRAAGTTFNVPLPRAVGDSGYVTIFDELLAPAARRFRPDLILLSAGYDAHWMDPLANMRLSISGFAQLMDRLMALADELCEGRLVAALEGGYDLGALSHSVLTTLRRLSHSRLAPSDPFGPANRDEPDISQLIQQLRERHGLQSVEPASSNHP